MKLLVHLLVLIGLSGLTGAAIVVHRTADLGGIKGTAPGAGTVADLGDLLGQATIKRSVPVEITETDLNRYLAATLKGRQNGKSGDFVNFDAAFIDLEPGFARVTLCWTIQGHRTTASIDMRAAVASGEHQIEIVSGAYGRMPVARGLLVPLMPAFASLAKSCAPEIKSMLSMTKINLTKDKLVLDPRY